MDYTNTDIGENSASGSCSATANYGGDEPDSDYTYILEQVMLRLRIVMQKAKGHVSPRSRGDISADRPSIRHHTSPHGRKPMILLHDRVQKPISSVKSVIKTCR